MWYFHNRCQVCVALIAKWMIRIFIYIGGCYFKTFFFLYTHIQIATLHYSSTSFINLKPQPRILEQNLALALLETSCCWMGTVCPFTWVKAARAWDNHSLPSTTLVKNEWRSTPAVPIRLHGLQGMTLCFAIPRNFCSFISVQITLSFESIVL